MARIITNLIVLIRKQVTKLGGWIRNVTSIEPLICFTRITDLPGGDYEVLRKSTDRLQRTRMISAPENNSSLTSRTVQTLVKGVCRIIMVVRELECTYALFMHVAFHIVHIFLGTNISSPKD